MLSGGIQRRLPRRLPEPGKENIEISFSRVRIEPTTCRSYSTRLHGAPAQRLAS